MGSPSMRTSASPVPRMFSQCSYDSSDTPPSTAEHPKSPIYLSNTEANTDANRVRQETLLKLCEARPREEKQTAESGLMDALACLRAMRTRPISFASSSGSSVYGLLLREQEAPVVGALYHDHDSRVLEWRQDLDETYPGDGFNGTRDAWRSFLPSCYSSPSLEGSSAVSSEDELDYDEPEATTMIRVEQAPICDSSGEYNSSNETPGVLYSYRPEPLTNNDHDGAQSQLDSTDEDEMWPYDGRGLYEHHSKYDCGLACFVACRLRRGYVPKKQRFGGLKRWLPWGRRKEEERLGNSAVPHPPWSLAYRSNDDILEDDEDDGDVEVWLEHVMEKEQFNHELRFSLRLDQVSRVVE
ncbi:hypothetical protein BDV93DRAFT_522762 [Ceratobasidium sp. AG-I]|nr:hypothetical protein BDV93DRAFT_522762 [Ceratobasidium sp. AG-I]